MITPILVLAATLAASPRLETFRLPAGQLPTEIVRHGDVMTFVSWKNWPAFEPSLGRIDPKGRIQMQALETGHMPGLMSVAPDGTLWISDGVKPVLWHVSKSGKVEQVAVQLPTLGIAADKTGAVWATHPESAEITRYGADGSVEQATFVGRRYPKSAAPAGDTPAPGVIPAPPRPAPAPVPQKEPTITTREQRRAATRDARPTWIVEGPDQAMWFCEPTWDTIGRVTAAGDVASFRVPEGWGDPGHITPGREGVLWFTVTARHVACNIDPANGDIRSVVIPGPATALAVDSEGRVWVVANQDFFWIDSEGAVHALDLPKAPRLIRSMAEGPDGAMWFADQNARVIGRVVLAAAAPGRR